MVALGVGADDHPGLLHARVHPGAPPRRAQRRCAPHPQAQLAPLRHQERYPGESCHVLS